MRIALVCCLLFSGTTAAAQTGPGWSIGVVDPPTVSVPNNTATVSGWAFHTGGAAILKVRVWLDCNPFAVGFRACDPQQLPAYTFGYARPDVVAYFPPYRVPENSGWMTALMPWFTVPDGVHWLFAGVTDAASIGWTQINPVCFRKWGGNALPCPP